MLKFGAWPEWLQELPVDEADHEGQRWVATRTFAMVAVGCWARYRRNGRLLEFLRLHKDARIPLRVVDVVFSGQTIELSDGHDVVLSGGGGSMVRVALPIFAAVRLVWGEVQWYATDPDDPSGPVIARDGDAMVALVMPRLVGAAAGLDGKVRLREAGDTGDDYVL